MEQGCLAGIIEAKEQDLRLLLPETQRGQHSVEPVQQKHVALDISVFGFWFLRSATIGSESESAGENRIVRNPKFPGEDCQGQAKQSREYCEGNQWTLDLVCPVEDDVVLSETKTTTDKMALFFKNGK